MSGASSWERFRNHFFHDEELGFSLDISRMGFDDSFLEKMASEMERAFDAMSLLESGEISNPDEDRMVGHYWLRDAEASPGEGLTHEIENTLERIRSFVSKVHNGVITGQQAQAFSHFVLVGIGGSALGPQLVAEALGNRADIMRPHFVDNTDPDGIRRTLGGLQHNLDGTLVLVVSKSGVTPETYNGMQEVRNVYERRGLNFSRHAVAVTGEGSRLDQLASKEGWLERFPMWDWVGGRTSITAAVGLLPAALQGIAIDELLEGAAGMDRMTRNRVVEANPSALLALMWYWAGGGRGNKDMVILPYKDRLMLLSKYLQQLVMESIGKEHDLEGNVVNQGIAVYGNKGSTDQHAYIQQLRDGLNNFFATFIEVLQDDAGSLPIDGAEEPVQIEPNIFTGDFLEGFLLGTREALSENGRESITITIQKLDPFSLGMLIALFERAVGFYATLVGINAYHQPGVEAGKKAARDILDIQNQLIQSITDSSCQSARTAEQWAELMGKGDKVETVFKLLERLTANPDRGVFRTPGTSPFDTTYGAV
jgi:glucose-6-phosphate isomerase